ncbi:MAG: DNA mismatch repair endonuclease MutL [Treponema sp.]|jgi:DNA mismatch repair protein MutL|nr:DNA mismatch repair endonuclease MutL [Treponema sp.]
MISVLRPEEARKIAAGEVIDRPASLVRELLDNAIDAGGKNIELFIEDGGSRRIEVMDDGCGMDKADLELCYYAHATSKIASLDDLNRAETLGFRGEALSAAAAVSKLDILSSVDGREAWRLEAGPAGRPARLEQARRVKGTSVRCIGLFDAVPARKRFLKRPSSEAALCYAAFIDKALCFPEIGFRFTQDGASKTISPSVSSFKERFERLVVEKDETRFLHEIKTSGAGFSVSIVIGGSEISRTDRRRQFLFANGRRIQDYSLQQALEYGVQGAFPNGAHPVGAIFIKIEPHLADFNIHPAKREARFVDADAIHHAITTALHDFSRHLRFSTTAPSSRHEREFDSFVRSHWEQREKIETSSAATRHLAMAALLENRLQFAERPRRGSKAEPADIRDERIRFAGKIFDLFIIIEKGERLFFIDQHAAHERVLYEKFLSEPIAKQELLVNITFNTDAAEDDAFLEDKRSELERLGVVVSGEDGSWRIDALPVNWRMGDAETVQAILDLRVAGENMAERWLATLACHAAVKDGDYLDENACIALAEAAFALSDPHCPHGRPIWFETSKEALLKAVKR